MKLCVIVDGFSTGSQYAPLLFAAGYTAIHIQSDFSLPETITREMQKKDYVCHFTHQNREETTQKILSIGKPEFIIPGADTGIHLADELSHIFNLKSQNVFEKSSARRDKFLMNETVRSYGLNAVKQLKTNKLKEIQEWMRNEKIDFPIVIKPLKSGSGEGFYFCRSEDEMNSAFNKLIGSFDLFNQFNEFILAQEFLLGKEYVINTVSHNGNHYVCEFALYHKIINENGNSIYQITEFLPRMAIPQILKDYTFKVLDALGIKFGPGHAEIIMNAGNPILVEVGARPMGTNIDGNLLSESYGSSQIAISILSYINPAEFYTITESLPNYLIKPLQGIHLASPETGIIKKIHAAPITERPSFKRFDLFVNVGDKIVKTKHLDEIVGIVYLQHTDAKIIQTDSEFLLQMPINHYLELS